jgi:hypothetical protein
MLQGILQVIEGRKKGNLWRKTKEWMLASIVFLVEKTSASVTILAAGIVSTTMCKK